MDLLAGMTVFLVAVGFVFGFVPGMFEPFETENGPNMVIADRSAALLAEDHLVDAVETPGVLNESCTKEFFDADGLTGDCRFDTDADDLPGALGIDEHRTVNVTIESGGTIRSVDGESLDVGPPVPSTADVVTAKRVTLLDGDQGTLFVRVW